LRIRAEEQLCICSESARRLPSFPCPDEKITASVTFRSYNSERMHEGRQVSNKSQNSAVLTIFKTRKFKFYKQNSWDS